MRIVWTEAARRDLREQMVHLAERSPVAAVRAQGTMLDAIERLQQFPRRGRQGRYEGTRELVVQGFPYIVVYLVGETEVTILRVLHGAQAWPPSPGAV